MCKKIFIYLHAQLRYGVMVALQILVLSVQVRILVSQPKRVVCSGDPLYFLYPLYSLYIIRNSISLRVNQRKSGCRKQLIGNGVC